MLESAECKLTTDYLKSKLENKVIIDFGFLSGKYNEKNPDDFNKFENNLPLIVENVQCKGTLIYITLVNEDGYFYIIHSLISGMWQESGDKYCRWYIDIDNDDIIWFRDIKSLSMLKFTSDYDYFQNSMNKLGPDILTTEFSIDEWLSLVHEHKNMNITSFMMNQGIISGIGNYIKAEALYYAKISPNRKVGSLKESEKRKLFEGIRIIPRISYNNGGIGKDCYGISGTYEKKFKIYGKAKAKKTNTPDGNITYWDSKIQS